MERDGLPFCAALDQPHMLPDQHALMADRRRLSASPISSSQ